MDDYAPGVVPPFYVRDGQNWADNRERLLAVSHEEIGASCYEGGVILPLRNRDDVVSAGTVFEGGVCDSDGAFVAGHRCRGDAAIAHTCLRAYPFKEEELVRRDESVVFGGIIFSHFGHQLTDFTSRLWYVTRHGLGGRRLALLVGRSWDAKKFYDLYKFILLALGVSEDDVLIVDEPTRFSEVVVPDEALETLGAANVAGREVYDRIREYVVDTFGVSDLGEKIYLTRRGYFKQDCMNEEFLEGFYERRGFRVVSPEAMSFQEQVAMYAGAREVVSTLGTLSHMATFFTPQDVALTYYLRAYEWMRQQLLLDKMFDKQPIYVDALRSPLPAGHAFGVVLFGTTPYFRAYLDGAGMDYDEKELAAGEPTDADIMAYLRRYEQISNSGTAQIRALGYDMADVFVSLHRGLEGAAVTRKDFEAASGLAATRNRLQGENKKLQGENKKLQGENKKLQGENKKLQGEAKRLQSKNKRLRSRLIKKADFSELVGPAVGVSACSYADGVLSLRLDAKALGDGDFAVVMANDPAEGRVPLRQLGARREKDAVEVELDLRGFFRGRQVAPEVCERWAMRVESAAGDLVVGLSEASRVFIAFMGFFLHEEGRLLVPYLDAEAGACFWLIGERCRDFPDGFFAARTNRPLVNTLLCSMLREGRRDVLARFARECERGRVRVVPLTDGDLFYKGRRCKTGPYAYQEACAIHRPLTPEQNARRWKWSKRIGRVRRALGLLR